MTPARKITDEAHDRRMTARLAKRATDGGPIRERPPTRSPKYHGDGFDEQRLREAERKRMRRMGR